MRVLVAAVLMILYAFAAPAQTDGAKGLERISINGNPYIRLASWTGLAGLRMQWNPRTGMILATNKHVRLGFALNSRRAAVNGVNVEMCLPVVARANVPMISAVDLQTSLNPILFPVRSPSTSKVKIICLDPGHGGKDTGKIDKTQLEKRHTLLLAEEIAQLLKSYDVKAVLTRTRDQTLDLSDRPDFARRKGADLFVSLHYNAAASSSVQGLEIHCMPPAGYGSSNEGGGRSSWGTYAGNGQNSQNVLLAYHVHKSILHTTHLDDRGLKRSHYKVLREARMPAVLIEGGFMSNPSDAKKIYDPVFRKKMAQAIVDGIIAYKRIVERR